MFRNTIAVGPFDPAEVCTTRCVCAVAKQREADGDRERSTKAEVLCEPAEPITACDILLESCAVDVRSAILGVEITVPQRE